MGVNYSGELDRLENDLLRYSTELQKLTFRVERLENANRALADLVKEWPRLRAVPPDDDPIASRRA